MGDCWAVVTGGPPAWADCGSHAARMADAFWRLGYRVLYIECGGDPRPFRRVLGERKQPDHTVVADIARRGFFVMRASQIPGLPLWFPEPVRRWNCARTSARAARFLSASEASRVVVCHCDWFLAGLFSEARQTVSHVYECTDDHAAAPDLPGGCWVRRHIERVEAKLLAGVDLAVFSSVELAEARGSSAPATAVLPPGVDADHFSRPAPADPHRRLGLPPRSTKHPRVGFMGRVTNRSDWAMVRAAAAATPDWQWVVVGPTERVRAKGPRNLHWAGAAKYQELPAWLQHWDVGIVPFIPGCEFNRRSWPLKLLEYAAAGLPVVSTDIPAARELARRLSGQVFIAREPTSPCFVETVRRALSVPAWKREAARSFVRRYSWEARSRQLLERLGQRAPR